MDDTGQRSKPQRCLAVLTLILRGEINPHKCEESEQYCCQADDLLACENPPWCSITAKSPEAVLQVRPLH